MIYDALSYPYSSRRVLAYAARGMVATSQSLAAQAGLDILKKAEMLSMLQSQRLLV